MPQTTHQARTARLETRIATSHACAKEGDVPVQQQGRGGTGQDKPWQPQQGYDQKEMLQPTPSMHDRTQDTSHTCSIWMMSQRSTYRVGSSADLPKPNQMPSR